MSLWAELKRRNVFRVALFYIVSAWLIVQVAETLLPVFDVSDAAIRVIVLILALGFPLAVVFSWVFEMTPEGLKRDKDIQVDPEIKQRTSNKLNWATLIAAVLAIGIVIADRLAPQPTTEDPSAHPAHVDEQPGAERPSGASAVGTDPEPTQATGSTRPSIAVLAFENMSSDPENAFFAEGISEEVLNVLAGVEGLRVASRTSAFSLSGRDTPVPEIAAQLGVDHVLEGSVRKAGNRVRITAQLIDAGDDAHLWSDVYDRELDDIFAVQEEIARSITGALTGILQTSMVSVDAPTENLEAYQAFLRGRSRFHQRIELDEAISDLRRAVELDPEFAQAWAMLAAAEYVVGGDGYRTNLDTAALKAQSSVSVDHALGLDARSPIAQAVKGQLLFRSGGSNTIEEGLMMLEGAASTLSPDSTPLLWLGLALMELGYPERARDVLERAQEQDPLVAINNGYLGLAYAMLGQQQRGQRYALRAVELSGSLTFWVDLLAISLANDGEAEQAVDLLEETQAWLDAEGSELMSRMIVALNEEWTFEQLAGGFSNSPDAGLIAYLQVTAALLLGDIETALLEASGSLDGPRYALALAAWLPSMIKLREHPAYFRWMSELGHVDYWRRHEFPFDCVEVHDQAGARLECGDSR